MLNTTTQDGAASPAGRCVLVAIEGTVWEACDSRRRAGRKMTGGMSGARSLAQVQPTETPVAATPTGLMSQLRQPAQLRSQQLQVFQHLLQLDQQRHGVLPAYRHLPWLDIEDRR